MAKETSGHRAIVGGHLPDGTRFEEGDQLEGLDAKTLKSLRENGIIAAAPAAKKKNEG